MKLIKAKTRLKNIPNAIVDDKYYPYLSWFTWYVTKKKGDDNYYYHTRMNGRWIKMHQLIKGSLKDKEIDHINHVSYDNRWENLRLVSRSINCHNRRKKFGSSIYKGVYRDKERNKWRAVIRINKKTFTIGRFNQERDAALAYNKAAVEKFGEYASINS